MIDKYTLFHTFMAGMWLSRMLSDGPTTWRITGLLFSVFLVVVDLAAKTPRLARKLKDSTR